MEGALNTQLNQDNAHFFVLHYSNSSFHLTAPRQSQSVGQTFPPVEKVQLNKVSKPPRQMKFWRRTKISSVSHCSELADFHLHIIHNHPGSSRYQITCHWMIHCPSQWQQALWTPSHDDSNMPRQQQAHWPTTTTTMYYNNKSTTSTTMMGMMMGHGARDANTSRAPGMFSFFFLSFFFHSTNFIRARLLSSTCKEPTTATSLRRPSIMTQTPLTTNPWDQQGSRHVQTCLKPLGVFKMLFD